MLGPGKCIYHEHRSPKMLVRPEKSKNIYLDCCCTAALIYQCSDADAFLMHLQITAEAPQSPSCHLFYPLIRNFPNSKLGYKGWRQKEMFLKEKVLNCSCQIIIFLFAWKLSSHEADAEITKTRIDFPSTPFASISMGLHPLCEEGRRHIAYWEPTRYCLVGE